MSNYSKFKDRAPQDTIFEIQRILNEAGLFTVLTWVKSAYSGVCSNRVTLYPTELGTNGKGTDQLYATASGYAELIERIQNSILALRMPIARRGGEGEFIAQPDEKLMPIDEVIAQGGPFLENIARHLNFTTDGEMKTFLTSCAMNYEKRTDGTILTVPFADLTGNRVLWVPRILTMEIYGSNGMAAGNTLEEAMVQAISELFERYANIRLVTGGCVPPVIPDEALKPYSIWNVIEQIRAEGRYSVTVYDCSLRIGLPVTGTMITDLHRGTFIMKLGAHPSFAVSVERTLTEIFQGREGLDISTGLCRNGSDQEARGYHNVPNVMKIGCGIYSTRYLWDQPDWEFRPWTDWEGLDNRGFLKKMLDQLRQLGYPVLVRDVSHLGFPSVQILAPGFSEMYPIEPLKFRAANSVYRNALSIGRFPDYTEEEEKRFLRAIQFKEGSFIENTIGNLLMLPLSGKTMTTDRIGAFLALKLGDYKEAGRFFHKVREASDDPEERLYLLCLSEYARYCAIGLDQEQVFKTLHKLYRADVADRVKAEVGDPETMMRKVFPKLNCPDCANCPIAGTECKQPQEAEVNRKIKRAMSHSRVSQTALLENLNDLMNT